MTTNLDKLAKRELIERLHSDQDRRSCTVQLTKAGLQLIDRAYGAHIANEEKMLASLTQAERSMLAQLLQRWLVANE